jgi:hypothetical protein
MFVLPTFGLGVIGSPTVPPSTFDTATLDNGQTAIGNSNTLTFTVNPSASISAGSTLTIAGLTGSQTSDSGSLTVGGAGAAIFGSSADWTQSSGTLVLTVAGGQSVPTGSDTVITFTLTNPATTNAGVTGITLASSGFTTANISGTFLNAITLFNVTTRDTEANILSSTPTNPSGEVNIAFGEDTKNFYIYDGSAWYIFNTDSFINADSVNLDGSNDYIDCGGNAAFSFTDGASNDNPFSISAWVYLNGNNRTRVAGKGNLEWLFGTGSTSKFSIFLWSNDSTSAYLAKEETSVLATGTWHHIVATYDGSNNVSGINLYRAGSLVTMNNVSSGTYAGMASQQGSLRLGQWELNSSVMNGLIDEVSVFNYELTSSQVSSIYNSGVPSDISDLSPLGWWRMGDNDGGTGTTITDQGSGGNNGTLTNGPTFSTSVPS